MEKIKASRFEDPTGLEMGFGTDAVYPPRSPPTAVETSTTPFLSMHNITPELTIFQNILPHFYFYFFFKLKY